MEAPFAAGTDTVGCASVLSARLQRQPAKAAVRGRYAVRPAGNAGPIASSRSIHQVSENRCLDLGTPGVDPRPCGGAEGTEKTQAAVRSVLTARRDASDLASDVAEMRERMRVEHGVDDIWSVKHILGGIVDIEFVAQYLQLKHAAETPEIFAGDTAAAFAVAGEKGLIATDVASELVNATILWRNLQGICG